MNAQSDIKTLNRRRLIINTEVIFFVYFMNSEMEIDTMSTTKESE